MIQYDVIIKEVKFNVLYVRHRGSYLEFRKESRKMFKRLFDFALKNQCIEEGKSKVMTIYHDNPYISEPDKLRTSVAISTIGNQKIELDDEVGEMIIQGKFAVGRFELNRKEYDKAWHSIYHDWLFKSNYEARDSFPIELYVDEPPRNIKDTSTIEIYVPIK